MSVVTVPRNTTSTFTSVVVSSLPPPTSRLNEGKQKQNEKKNEKLKNKHQARNSSQTKENDDI